MDKNTVDTYINDIYNNRHSDKELYPAIYNQYYQNFKKQAEAGWGSSFDKIDTLEDFKLTSKIKENLSRFAAGKQQALSASLERILYDANMNKLSKQDFDKAAAPILKQFNKNWYRTESDTIRNLTISAWEWREIERQAYLYPNLRYETVGDDKVREAHRLLDGTVRPVNDPFWQTHFPPNGWNCRCVTIQTDDAPTELPNDIPTPDKGFNQNPGMTGELFSEDHPYFQMEAATKDKIFAEAEKERSRNNRDHIKNLAKENLATPKTELIIPEIEKPVVVTASDIKNMLSHYHSSPAIKDELIPHLQIIAPELRLIKSSINDDPKKTQVSRFLYYLFEMNGKEFFFNIQMIAPEGIEIAKIYAIGYLLK